MNYNFKLNTATEEQILLHLQSCDQLFKPPLSSFVVLDLYSRKLESLSTKFEAWNNSVLVGLVAVYLNDPKKTDSFITNVSVLEIFHGKGIAKDLILKSIEYAKKLNFSSMQLEVNENNASAIGLYKHLGFKETSQKNGRIKMKKDLTSDSL